MFGKIGLFFLVFINVCIYLSDLKFVFLIFNFIFAPRLVVLQSQQCFALVPHVRHRVFCTILKFFLILLEVSGLTFFLDFIDIFLLFKFSKKGMIGKNRSFLFIFTYGLLILKDICI